ncbi:MAG: hypothetical protein BV459_00555 [Thermoplasmata archaeon M11B2D]|nr:MAG: hypothetical protein BV459_00555 [Thermoplasmata archaeon M11B2D]
MKTFKEFKRLLIEKRSHAEQNPRARTAETLLKYKTKKHVYVSFSPINKLGVNPKSNWSTPQGVYAYPIGKFADDIREYLSSGMGAINVFPYAGDRPHVFVVKTNPSAKVMDLKTGKFSEKEFLKKSKQLSAFLVANNYTEDDDDAMEYFYTASVDYDYTHKALYKALHVAIVRNAANASATTSIHFNKALRIAGFDAVEDRGTNTIFNGEPWQIVYLTPKAYTIEESIYNDETPRMWRDRGGHIRRGEDRSKYQ